MFVLVLVVTCENDAVSYLSCGRRLLDLWLNRSCLLEHPHNLRMPRPPSERKGMVAIAIGRVHVRPGIEQHLDEIKAEGAVNEAVSQVAFADRLLLTKRRSEHEQLVGEPRRRYATRRCTPPTTHTMTTTRSRRAAQNRRPR